MAVICTVLASTGFVAAGYADTSSADAAVSLSPQTLSRIASTYDETAAIGFDAVAAQAPDVKMSFEQLYIQSRQPAAQQVLDLTDPNGNTPHLSRGLNAMRGDVPEISLHEISKVRRDILTAAYVGLGHPYIWGGTSFEHGWDCSGFVQWAYAHAGITLPRTEQWVPMVETNNPQPGDIVVQNPDGPNHWSHIGIYVGNGKMISALNPSVGTILHTPGATSSSSTYFTIPAFATADEQAKADAAAKKADAATPTASATATPTKSATAKPTPTKPATTSNPATTQPTPTKSATAKPTPTKPATTSNPATTQPTPTKSATAKPTPTKPATPTAPATTKSATPTPTTPPATVPPKTVPTTATPTPSATAPATTAPATTDPEPTAPATTAPATTTEPFKTAAPSETPTPSSFTTVSPTAVETTAGTKTADQTRTQSTTTETPTSQTPSSETPTADPTAVPSQ